MRRGGETMPKEYDTMREISWKLMDLYDWIDQQADTPKNAAILTLLETMTDIALKLCERMSEEG